MTEELKQKIDKIVRDYYTSPKALALYRNLKGLAYDVAEEATKELEKENAELKKLKRECETSLCRAEYQYNYEQLTKAKELLERLLITSCNSDVLNLLPNCSEVLRARVEAEQFLKE